MMTVHRRHPLAAVAVLALTAAGAWAADKPLKVFVLAGQSNMQGHARTTTFDSLADDPKTAPLLKEMRGPDGKPRVCDRVWISSVGCLGDAYTDLTEARIPPVPSAEIRTVKPRPGDPTGAFLLGGVGGNGGPAQRMRRT